MSANGVGSVVAYAQTRWSRFRRVGALAVIGLYFASLIRLAVSKDWDDLTADRLFGLTLFVGGLLVLADGLDTMAANRPAKQRTKRRKIAGLVVAGSVLAGITTSLIRTGMPLGDPVAQLFTQTALIGLMLLVIADVPDRDRPFL
ncbi:hypothetical protein AB0G00_05275 [Nocardia salmonicida]|uniref:hypothetical protein n=1 Tax=Nocardia salmonicida TaxID=53431 RepID=UPI0033D56114